MIASSNAQWQNGDILPEIGRAGIINAYEDPTFRTAFKKIVAETDRPQIILAGVTIGTCTLFPALSLQNDGYAVYPVIVAAGAWNRYEADAAIARMVQAGAQPVSISRSPASRRKTGRNPGRTPCLSPSKRICPSTVTSCRTSGTTTGRRSFPTRSPDSSRQMVLLQPTAWHRRERRPPCIEDALPDGDNDR
jgi:isochorismatase family protein